jgi:hypothetical protein
MPRPVEDRLDVGGAAQFNNTDPSRFLSRPAFCLLLPDYHLCVIRDD